MEIPINIDDNEIVEEISSGGHAVVFKSWSPVFEKHYAIKVMRPEATEVADRFLTEAKVLSQIEHPNIPRIYSYGKYEGRPFLRMDFIDGKNLNYILAEKDKLPEYIAIGIVLQVANALKYAHNLVYEIYGEKRRGIIHRDIKPGNILIDKNGSVKLIDFGIVKVDKLSIHTTSFSFVGTPSYMSPEQIDSSDGEDEAPLVDLRCDVYSLGCVLFECLTGKKQFKSDTISRIVNLKEKNKYDFSLLQQCSKAIQKIIAKATSAEKEKRFQSIDEMIETIVKYSAKNKMSCTENDIQKYIFNENTYSNTKYKKRKPIFIFPVIAVAVVMLLIISYFWLIPSLTQLKFGDIVLKESGDSEVERTVIDTLITVSKNDETIKKPIEKTPKVSPHKNIEKVVHKDFSKEVRVNNPSVITNVAPIQSDSTFYQMFTNKKYHKIADILSSKSTEELSDSLFLIYCGSLLNTDIVKMSQIVMSRSIEDGYIQYLWGRYMMSKDKWEMANGRFLLSLSKKSAISFKEDLYFNFVISSYNLYKKIPNIENREFFKARKADYLENYCNINGLNNSNCSEVDKMMLIP